MTTGFYTFDSDAVDIATDNLMSQVEGRIDRLIHDRPPRFPFLRSTIFHPSPIYLGDIEYALERFSLVTAAGIVTELGVPSVRGPYGMIPVDAASVSLDPNPIGRSRRGLRDLIGRLSPRSFKHLAYLPFEIERDKPTQTFEVLRQRLKDFLSIRFGAYEREQRPVGGGLPFRVSTSTEGLRVHYSPAYILNLNTVFGEPTTPVDRMIQPGRYVFGVARKNGRPKFDLQSHYSVPDDTHARLLL